MIEPRFFISNPETRADNSFQKDTSAIQDPEAEARKEFINLKALLESHGINVLHYRQDDDRITPDAIFPNNWFSTHPDGTMILYPMKAGNRRLERREKLISLLKINYPHLIDLSGLEKNNIFLEGTGSLVIDHRNRIAYACLSGRTNPEALKEWANQMHFRLIIFTAIDRNNTVIYHTNVVMTIGEKFAILCSEAIRDNIEKMAVLHSLRETGHAVVEITFSQMHQFCGNCLELINNEGKNFLVMSTKAFIEFTDAQKRTIEKHAHLLHSDVNTIETLGGGGVRCMLAELF